jgi:hypothetical protein
VLPASFCDNSSGMTKHCGSFRDKKKENNMYDQEIPASQVKADRFPFPSE